ncbi:unnamed protein product [Nippostrongylus brasiliensis]|uniref:Uncharacterized protein n=1 Tax=Nippostrongylus brasiliensis TaxID=27835 RepID=A0A0N4XPA0_NIPBR|nr:unnamed protein product [Nippostrongylus brasiliensis]
MTPRRTSEDTWNKPVNSNKSSTMNRRGERSSGNFFSAPSANLPLPSKNRRS